ncbi:hypothetical protein BGX38DRAFT_1134072 [Terfezia claveryi]|nr:hypothetical protein BGX38DRAFT_1134072 [Terfezia claveryi]
MMNASVQSSSTSAPFNTSLSRLQRILDPTEKQEFQWTSLDDLYRTIDKIQQEQVKKRHLQYLNRIKPFIECMLQYGQVIEVFLNTSKLLAFIWGPMKFILQTASNYTEAMENILDTYEGLGECLPQFKQYEVLFRKHWHMQRVLEYVYEDILDFHRTALRFFKQGAWSKFFHCTWKGVAVAIRTLKENLRRHKSLVETQATLSHFEEAQIARETAKEALKESVKNEQARQRMAVIEWFSSPDSETDHERYSGIREKYPGTGRWLLRARMVKRWLDSSTAGVPVLWLYGKPGAGKTILASVIVEEARAMKKNLSTSISTPNSCNNLISVAFFYCRHGNPNKNSFINVMKGLIVQICKQNPEILPVLYNEISRSGEIGLSTRKDASHFLEIAIMGSLSLAAIIYIVVDGLDECEEEEMIKIVETLTSIAQSTSGGACRLFFTSRDESAIQRVLSTAVKYKLRPQDNAQDLEVYAKAFSIKIKEKFNLSEKEKDHLTTSVTSNANGMFLFCVLVLQNLLGQTTKAELGREMAPGTFPSGLEQAYGRIIDRINRNSSSSQRQSAFKIMSLLALSKRPLKRYEIQGFFSIAEDGIIDHENLSFRDNIKDLCGSLVEVCSGDIIDFVHGTVKTYLKQENLLESAAEINLAIHCVRYLSSICCSTTDSDEVKKFTMRGSYAFLDYAAVHWIDHVRFYAATRSSSSSKALVPFLRSFFDMHWPDKASIDLHSFSATIPDEAIATPDLDHEEITSIKCDLRCFESEPEIFWKLAHLVSLVQRLRNHRIEAFSGPLAYLKLGMHIQDVHTVLERLFSMPGSAQAKQQLETYYGTRCFKCRQEDCAYFSDGFSTEQERDQHQEKHNRDFFCPEPGCGMASISYGSAKTLKTHIDRYHQPLVLGPNFPAQPRPESGLRPHSKSKAASSHEFSDREYWSVGKDHRKAASDIDPTADWHIVFNPDIQRMLDVSLQCTLNMDFGRHSRHLSCLAMSPNGSVVATASITPVSPVSENMQLFDTTSGELVFQWRSLAQAVITCLCFSPDGSHLAAGSTRYGLFAQVMVWKLDVLNSQVKEIASHTSSTTDINALTFSYDGKLIASSSTNGDGDTVRVWNFKQHPGFGLTYDVDADLTVCQTVSFDSIGGAGNHGYVKSIAFLPIANDYFIAAGTSHGKVLVWNASSGTPLWGFEFDTRMNTDFPSDIRDFIFSYGQKLTLFTMGFIHVRSRESMLNTNGILKRVVVLPGGITSPGAAKFYPLHVSPGTFLGHKAAMLKMALAPGGEWLISAAENNEIFVWNANSATPHLRMVSYTKGEHLRCFSASNRPSNADAGTICLFATAAGADSIVRIWRLHKYLGEK